MKITRGTKNKKQKKKERHHEQRGKQKEKLRRTPVDQRNAELTKKEETFETRTAVHLALNKQRSGKS